MKNYIKPALTFEQQVNQLEARGLIISDRLKAVKTLTYISYYRFSGYCYPFRKYDENKKISDDLIEGTTWDEIIRFYEFDRRLRLLILDAIERVEVTIRTQLTYHLAHKYGALSHVNASIFHSKFNHASWLAKVEQETERSSDEFIKHYKREYKDFPKIPIWMLTEIQSLGSLSLLYQGLIPDDKRSISAYFKLHAKRLESWLHTLTYVRNVCAHHSRLWNRELAIRPDVAKEAEWKPPITPRNDRVFYVLLMLRHLLSTTSNDQYWVNQVNLLLAPFAEHRKWRAAMGIPDTWRKHPIWAQQT